MSNNELPVILKEAYLVDFRVENSISHELSLLSNQSWFRHSLKSQATSQQTEHNSFTSIPSTHLAYLQQTTETENWKWKVVEESFRRNEERVLIILFWRLDQIQSNENTSLIQGILHEPLYFDKDHEMLSLRLLKSLSPLVKILLGLSHHYVGSIISV
jgi:hypothetical protein